MNKGKVTCEVLKEIRKQIADQNDIDYQTHECTFEGECRGTCPACESEIHYLENEIVKKKYLGKAVVLAGLSVGILSVFTACHKGNHIESKNDKESQIKNAISNSNAFSDINKKDSINKFTKLLKNNTTEPFEPFIGIEMPEPEIVFPENDTTYKNDILNIGGIVEIESDSNIYYFVEQMPEFPGGKDSLMQYLKNELKYPNVGEKNISGSVLIEFIVETDGSISNVHALVILYPEFDAEAIRVISSSPKWIPGKQKGKPVRVKQQLPIRFSLE